MAHRRLRRRYGRSSGSGRCHIVAINTRTRRKTYMTSSPLTHSEARIMLTKLVRHKGVRYAFEEA